MAKGISTLIGKKETLGEVYHITSPKTLTWGEVAEIYDKTIYRITGSNLKYQITKNDIFSHFGIQDPQIKYDRIYTRIFNNEKIGNYINVETFTTPYEGLQQCIADYIKAKETIYNVDWYKQALMDRVTGDKAMREEFASEGDWNFYKSIRYPSFTHKVKIFLYSLIGRNIL